MISLAPASTAGVAAAAARLTRPTAGAELALTPSVEAALANQPLPFAAGPTAPPPPLVQLVGAAAGNFGHLQSVAVDASGNVYAADMENRRVQVFDSTAHFVRQWPVTVDPLGVAIDASGTIFITGKSPGPDGHDTFEFTPSGTLLLGWAVGAPCCNYPFAIAPDNAGGVFTLESSHGALQHWSAATGAPDTTFSSPTDLRFNTAIAVHAGNVDEMRCDSGPAFQQLDLHGNLVASWGTPADFKCAVGVAVDAGGRLHITDSNQHQLLTYSPTGTRLAAFGSFGAAPSQFYYPENPALDSAGDLWVADTANSRAQEFDPSGAFLRAFGRPTFYSANGAVGIAEDGSGHLWVADTAGDTSPLRRISEIDLSGNLLARRELPDVLPAGTNPANTPSSVAVDQAGRVDVLLGAVQANTCSNAYLVQLTSQLTFSAATSTQGCSIGPNNTVAIDAQGLLYLADNGAVNRLGSDLAPVSSFPTGAFGTGDGSITVDPQGRVYLTNGGGQVGAWLPNGQLIGTWSANNKKLATGTGPDGSPFAIFNDNQTLIAYDPTSPNVQYAWSLGANPLGLAVSQSRVWVATASGPNLAATLSAYASLHLSTVTPPVGSDSGPATVTVTGRGLVPGATAALRMAGQPSIAADSVSVAADGGSAVLHLDLTGKPNGLWDVVLVNPDGSSASLPAAYTIQGGGRPLVWATITGFGVIRSDVPQRYLVTVSNGGGADADGVMVRLVLPGTASISFPDPNPLAGLPGSPSLGRPFPVSLGSTAMVPLGIPSLPAGARVVIPFDVTVASGTPTFDLTADWFVSGVLPPSSNPAVTVAGDVLAVGASSISGVVHVNSPLHTGDISIGISWAPASGPAAPTLDDVTVGGVRQITVTETIPVSRFGAAPARAPLAAAAASGDETVTAVINGGSELIDTYKDAKEAQSTIDEQIALLQMLTYFRINGCIDDTPGFLERRGDFSQLLFDVGGKTVQTLIGQLPIDKLGTAGSIAKSAINATNPYWETQLWSDLARIARKHSDASQNGPLKWGLCQDPENKACQCVQDKLFALGITPFSARMDDGETILKAMWTCYQKDSGSASQQVAPGQAHDPNAMLGPPGAGAARYVPPTQPLSYEVAFENLPGATLPAQAVTISNQLDAARMNLSTFQLGPISFGSRIVIPPAGAATYSTLVDLRPATGLQVRIDAALSASGLATWRLQSIDPATGLPPANPALGFLPPDTAPPGGEGFVSYTVAPIRGLASGSSIANQAAITFDNNAPMATNSWVNTIDAVAPVSHVDPLPANEYGSQFAVTWGGTDDASGIARYDIKVSVNGAASVAWISGSTGTGATFIGQAGNTYAFSSQATDAVGNREAPHGSADTSTALVIAPTTTTVSSSVSAAVFGQAVAFTAMVAPAPDGGTVQFSVDGLAFGVPVPLNNLGLGLSPSIATLTPGNHVVGAAFSGDVNFLASTGSFTQIVGRAATATSMVSSLNPSAVDQPVTFTITVSAVPPGAGTPTGSVQLMVNGSNNGAPVALTGGQASLTVNSLPVGRDAVSAAYSGDANFSSSASAPLTQVVRNNLIAFTSLRDGNFEVYVTKPDSMVPTRLTLNRALDSEPALSPDGTRVAFTSSRGGSLDIWMMKTAPESSTNVPLNLTRSRSVNINPAWSPDGSKIAFASTRSGRFQIWVMNRDGSGVVRLTRDGANDVNPAWSPDGTRLAFASDAGGRFQIYVATLTNSPSLSIGSSTRLTTDSATDLTPAWSPDGDKIAYTSTASGSPEIWVTSSRPGGTAVRQTSNPSGLDATPTWSPDGTQIAFTSTAGFSSEISEIVYNATGLGTAQRQITNGGSDALPNWCCRG